MSREDVWMPLYIGDYLRDTGHLSGGEHGAYLLLLIQAWTRDGALPVEDDRLRALARMDRRQWDKSRDAVMAFFVIKDGAYRNARLDREILRARQVSVARQLAGAVGGNTRWAKTEQNQGASDSKRDSKTIATPIANHIANGWQKHTQSQSQSDKKEEPPALPTVGRSPRGCRLPADWTPDPDLRAFADGLGLRWDRVAANFRDYWHAKAGKDAAKVDWSATWRGWCRKEAERLPRSGAPPPSRPSNLSWMAAELGMQPSTDPASRPIVIIDPEPMQ